MIALDTSALIWAVQGEDAGDSAIAAARRDAIADMGSIMIPAPALAEYLCGLLPEQRMVAVNDLQAFASVPPFDVRAAILAADMLQKPRRGSKTTRREFKIDAMILAVAVARNATKLLHRDGDFDKLAEGQPIQILDVDTIKVQPGLPFKATD